MQVGKRILSALWNGAKLPCPAWAVGLALALSVASASAAVGTLYGSLNVPTSGTITDNNASINSCVNTNGSKQFTYTAGVCLTQNGGQTVTSGDTFNSTTTLAGLDIPAQGTASSGTQHFASFNGELDASDWNGSTPVTNSWTLCEQCEGGTLGTEQLQINYNGVTAAVFQYTSGNGHQWFSENGQISAEVPNGQDEISLLVGDADTSKTTELFDVSGGNTTNGTGNEQFGIASQGAVNIFSKPTTACQTNAPIASLCIGSPTPTIALAIGKQTGGWGGTTTSASGQLCFIDNKGTGDETGRCMEASNGIITFIGNSVQTGPLTVSKLTQSATGDVWGSCSMSASTSCTITWSYTPTFCGSPNPLGTTVINGVASISSTTITITAASSNSQTWDVTCS